VSHETVVKKSIGDYSKVKYGTYIAYQRWHTRFTEGYWQMNFLQAMECGSLLKLPFTTIFEYLQVLYLWLLPRITYQSDKNWKTWHVIGLQLLRMVGTSVSSVGLRGMFYLAAAVSDFYVPWDSMVWLKKSQYTCSDRFKPRERNLITLWKNNLCCKCFS
jgi:hypothetical protein